MNSMNTIMLEGNVVRDPEFKTTSKGTSLCTFSIAVNRTYKTKNGFEKEVSFFDIETWAKWADICKEQIVKGRGIRVVGRLKQNRWNDDDGKGHSRVTILAEHVEFRPIFRKTEKKEEDETDDKLLEAVEEANEASIAEAAKEAEVVF
ncbi:MAG TPA: single-stranded DNA-binding protein [Treponemataceae bacterium]|nr:single-stranded DNA-binding protein [Treponemataceae bacterium]